MFKIINLILYKSSEIIEEKQNKIQQGNNDSDTVADAAHNESENKINEIKNRQPFNLNRYKEEKIYLKIREQYRESEKQAVIKVSVGCVASYQTAKNSSYNPDKVINVKFKASPL